MLCLITCFHGRHSKVERIIRCFLNQEYEETITLLLFNNCSVNQFLDKNIQLSDNKTIKLVNNGGVNQETNTPYTNVGDIFRDALHWVPDGTTVVNFFDSDDIFLPNHAQEGVKNLTRAHFRSDGVFRAYKPYYSYYVYGNNKVEKAHNNMEPSIFVDFEYVKKEGFHKVAASYHQKWLDKLQKDQQIFVPKEGVSTFVYDWGEDHNTHKISGLGDHKDNFEAHRRTEVDHGDGVLSPAPAEEIQKYYDLINQYETTTSNPML